MDPRSLPNPVALSVLLELDQEGLEDLLVSGCAPGIIATPYVLEQLCQKHKFPRCDTLDHLQHCLL